MKWSVSADLTGGIYLGEVEADDLAEAKEKGARLAAEAVAPSLCHQCGTNVEIELGDELYVSEVSE